jgi:hypothetical protein
MVKEVVVICADAFSETDVLETELLVLRQVRTYHSTQQ